MALLEMGQPAPGFKGQNLTGPEFHFEHVKGKKPVILIFAPDRIDVVQMKQTAGVYNKIKPDVEMVVMARKIPGVAAAKIGLSSAGLKCPVIYDPRQEVFQLYGVEKPVVVYSIDRDGTIKNVAEYEPKGMGVAQLHEAADKAR